ncbi:hypothetical protein CTAYLR_003602 [Chrysophaeum taylorii]|uniref:Uncharacterized protein n=1 Tax=Chrysophaeum taylorii TaxID=2483200 RepID=A0AAD7UC31_9STRA|nr:hypothetical protein CTAYLR_003602 [Chrysophaeum taylorii]
MEIGFLEKKHGEFCSELVGCDDERVLTSMLLFYVLAAAGTAFNLLAVILASFCMIFGPELAIRGTEESMHHAVKGMYEERRQALKYFWIGCLFIVLSGIALAWMKFPVLTSGLITGVFCSLVLFCSVYVRKLRPLFAYEDEDLDISQIVEGVAQSNTLSAQRQQQRRGGRGAASRYGAVSATTTVIPEPGAKSGNVFVDNMLRYAVLADKVLRLFLLDGSEVGAYPLADIRVGRDHYVPLFDRAQEARRWCCTRLGDDGVDAAA